MRVIVVGLGVQGYKRRTVAGGDVAAAVDPVNPEAQYKDLAQVPPGSFDAALVCTPDEVKIDLLTRLIESGKHVLVEKPLFAAHSEELARLGRAAAARGVTCYTAYNHRFEPHFVRMKALLDSGRLGRVYSLRMFYGNGTARLVRDSAWRDRGAGVLPDLGSHLLDTILYWFGKPAEPFRLLAAKRFENRAPDHVTFGTIGTPMFNLEVTLLSWRNHFYADLFAEGGSAHIQSLCKWGPATFTVRDRKLPSGRPDEESITLVEPDPTWDLEYQHFKSLCAKGESNIDNDIWINEVLAELSTC
ncbi:MAG TPA: Gfo/Idh/MocA family oxidoreductase [Candidatus Acidoferrum sp.]|jgi:scyllo-inositol 2-dehydrogenase (NADP+)|nr:Gfo/Idh/MocA family oxidoreductase [Candidatus Acidoferrum sp.]